MRTPTITELKATWSEPRFFTDPVTKAAIALLADGRPAAPHALAAATGASIDQVTAAIAHGRAMGMEVEDGAIVGAALTLRPTNHGFRVRGNDLYTWCGFDALFLPILLGERAEVTSTCPVTGTAIRLTVESDGTVSAAAPAGIVVGIVGDNVTSCCTAAGPGSDICTQMPFFASRDAGERWLDSHPDVAVVGLDAAREIARGYVSAS